MKPIAFVCLFLFMNLGCSEGKMEMATVADLEETVAPNQKQLQSLPRNDIYSDGRSRIIKTANYRFRVDDMRKTVEALEAAVGKYNAYFSSSDLELEGSVVRNKIVIRVQSEYFNDLLKEVDAQASFIEFRNIVTSDVAKEFVDLESRLKTKREVEARYAQILRSKAGTIEELLNAEEKIGKLHEEIEATVSRLNYLKNQLSYSTLNLDIYQSIDENSMAKEEVALKDKFQQGLSAGWEGVVQVALAITYIWPIVILGIAILLALRFRRASNTA